MKTNISTKIQIIFTKVTWKENSSWPASIVGCCPFSLCRRPNFRKVALWKLHTTRQKTQNCSWASSTLFSPSKSTAMKTKIKLDCYEETGYTCWHILLQTRNGKELIQSSLWTGSLCGVPPEEMCLSLEQKKIKTRRKPLKKWLFWSRYIFVDCHFRYTQVTHRYTFYVPQTKRLRVGFAWRAVRQRGYGLRLLIFKMANGEQQKQSRSGSDKKRRNRPR